MRGTQGSIGAVPWWTKIVAKIVLSRIPIARSAWQRLGLFRHGAMDEAGYALGVFRSHWKRSGEPPLSGAVVLELGPGDSIATAVIARAYGASAILVDSGDFAVENMSTYHRVCDELKKEGSNPPDLSDATSRADVLRRCDAQYLTNGLDSIRELPSDSVDMIFSQAVLEHVRRDEFDETLRELNRVLKPQGLASHRVDLKDHLGGGLNNLRFSRRVWESRLFSRAGFYTNRLAYSEMLATFSGTHEVLSSRITQEWETPPIDRARLAREFRDRDDKDLAVAGFDVLLGPSSSADDG